MNATEQVVWHGPEELRPLLRPIATIAQHPRNARRGDVALVLESLTRFGQTKPVVAHRYHDEDRTWIVAGNHLQQAAIRAGWTHIAVSEPDLTDDEADQYLHMDNRSSDLSTYDHGMLIAGLSDLQERALLDGSGYSQDELQAMIDDANAAAAASAEFSAGFAEGSGGGDRGGSGSGSDLKSLILSMDPASMERLQKRLKILQKEYGTEDIGATIARAMELEFQRTWSQSATRKVEVPDTSDDAPLTPKRPRTKTGELVDLGAHRLVCGDARDPDVLSRLMGSERAQAIWTDPPYGVDYVGGTKDALTIRGDTAAALPGLLAAAFDAAGSVSDNSAPFYVAAPSWPQGSSTFRAQVEEAGWRLHQVLVWVKDVFVLGHSDYHYQHEDVLYGYLPGDGRPGRGRHKGSRWHGDNAQSSVFQVARPKRSEEHPTMKPVELIAAMLTNALAPGEIVLDPFAGSGSTLIAAEVLGMRARLVEVDRGYCDVIRDRYAAFVKARSGESEAAA